MNKFSFKLISAFILCLLITSPVVAAPKGDYDRVEIQSYQDLLRLFKSYNYTNKAWKKGIREVPRLKFTFIPERWASHTAHEISVKLKKEIFFRALAPLVLTANEQILQERLDLFRLIKAGKLNAPDLLALARKYRLATAETTSLTVDQIEELKKRVDKVPLSLVLAQGAEESGWGTSRFAVQGNALFGQWTWGGKGIKPKGQRQELGNYKIATFDTPLDSVIGYLNNLNTNKAYEALREERARLREADKPVTGLKLVKTLDNYSERGDAYVRGLKAIIRVNHLAVADEARLMDMAPVLVVPVEKKSS